MANQYGTKKEYKVYEVVRVADVGAFGAAYGLVYIKSFDDSDEAEEWVVESGERNTDYTIVKVFRNK